MENQTVAGPQCSLYCQTQCGPATVWLPTFFKISSYWCECMWRCAVYWYSLQLKECVLFYETTIFLQQIVETFLPGPLQAKWVHEAGFYWGEKVNVTWHAAKYGDPYSEFMLCIYPFKVHAQQWTHAHREHTPVCFVFCGLFIYLFFWNMSYLQLHIQNLFFTFPYSLFRICRQMIFEHFTSTSSPAEGRMTLHLGARTWDLNKIFIECMWLYVAMAVSV